MDALHKALSRVHAVVEKKRVHVIHTSEISRTDREILLKNRWLEEVVRGWYLFVRPDLMSGDSTAWFSNFWDFLRVYLEHHYGTQYCLSAECSLDLLVGSSIIPRQVIVIALGGSGTGLQLPHGTSLLVYSDPERLPAERVLLRGLQTMSLEYALCKVSPAFFRAMPQEAELALRSVHEPSTLLRCIAQYNFKSAAGRLVGAYRFLGDTEMMDALKKGLESIGMRAEELNPFEQDLPLLRNKMVYSPYVARLQAMWESFRESVKKLFPEPPGLSKDKKAYMKAIAEQYVQDAYNSLSIEGYKVSEGLISRVKKAEWNPDLNHEDKEKHSALAAKGYYDAHLLVKESVLRILEGGLPGNVARENLHKWYQKMFAPMVNAGILSAADLFGYRRGQVYIRGSRHTPPSPEYVRESMDALFELLEKEEHAGVRAVLGHFMFVYIHPYMDGNGRMARFLMNVMLASGGYPWTIIHVANRDRYMTALESASVDQNVMPFTSFVAEEVLQRKKS